MYFSSPLSVIFNMWLLNCIVILKYSVLAYNLDIDRAKVFNVPAMLNDKRGSYFGFSVALYANGKDSTLLVGAPRANTSTLPNIIEPGSVYQCPINDTCKEWIIDSSKNGPAINGNTYRQIRDNAWIGATISIENSTKPRIAICAPRWKQSGDNRNWFMNGICYWTVINNIESFKNTIQHTILPDEVYNKQIIYHATGGYYAYGMSAIGFSVHMNYIKSIWSLILGSPGIFAWQGSVVISRQLSNNKMRIVSPLLQDDSQLNYYDYFGYSVTSGCYFNKTELWLASGAPRSGNMYGTVIISRIPEENDNKLKIKEIVSGEQYGEYFGAAVASCDLNGDDKDELIVGAPQWTRDINEGRIYMFTTLHNANFEKQSFEGEFPKSRFGSVVTCLGDIDYDGYGDIAVSAPYERETGAIYIFNGKSSGLLQSYSQKIIGSQFGKNVRGFGISIAEPRDINGDKYPDLAVGAYLSEKAILIKSKPVVTVSIKLIYNEKMKLSKNSTFFFVDLCTSYSGINIPKNLRIVSLLKIDQMYRRAFYDADKKNDIYTLLDTLYAANKSCKQLQIHLKKNIQNVIDPLEISASIMLEDDMLLKQKETQQLNISCTSCAAINKHLSKTEDTVKLPFAVDCGEDNICISDVRVTVSTDLKGNNRYVIGSISTVKFIINVTNYGEPAYQAKIYVYIPEIISLASIPPPCMENSYVNSTLEVICDVGNPLKKNESLILELDMSKVWFNIDHVTIWTNFTTQSEQRKSLSNMTALTIYFDVDVDIAIAGKAQEDLYSYFFEGDENETNNLQFKHIYEVQKFGTSPIEKATLVISIPTYWKQSTEDIWIASINQTISHMEGQKFDCTYSNSTPSVSLINNHKLYFKYSELNTPGNSTIGSVLTNLPPNDRTLYINCTNINIKCTYIECELNSFVSSSSVAKLSLTLDLHLLNLKSNLMKEKDIIYFVSDGNVYISQVHNITQKPGHKPDNTIVATMFVGSPIAKRVATWIKILSIILGILLLILLIFGLIKVGFFNRKQKEELQALKSETNTNKGITLETSSSREDLT